MAHLFIIARYPFRSHSEGRIPTESGMDFLSARLSFGHMRLLSFFLVSRKAGYLLKLGLYLFSGSCLVRFSARVIFFIYHSEGGIQTEARIGLVTGSFPIRSSLRVTPFCHSDGTILAVARIGSFYFHMSHFSSVRDSLFLVIWKAGYLLKLGFSGSFLSRFSVRVALFLVIRKAGYSPKLGLDSVLGHLSFVYLRVLSFF